VADRSLVVRLRAEIAGFKQAMKDAAKAVRGVSDATGDAEQQTSTLTDRMRHSAEEHQQAWEKVGKTMLITGGVIGAGVGLAVKSFADFDKEMSQVRAVSGASSSEMEKLSAAALQAGADTKFSATEAAQATGELAKVGISTSDILGGALTGSLDLAAAGNLDLADAATISGQAMKLFGLQGKDVGHIADVLAAGANKSAADVTDLAQALSQGGLVAAQTGLTLDDTVGTLSAFADNALLGSDAGTSFKTMLQRLNPQSAEAQKLMDQLGLSAYDAQGNFVGIAQYAGKLQDALGKMSVEQRNAAMQTLFGSDAVRAANVLYKLGADGVRDYVSAVNDQGAAARVAAINMDNLAGDVEQLRGSIETGLTQAGAGANDALRALTQSGTAAVNFVNNLPGPLIQVGLGFAAVTSAALLTGGAITTLMAKSVAARATMVELGITSQVTATRMTAAAKGAGILAAAIVGVSAAGAAFDTVAGRQAQTGNAAAESLLAYAKAGRDAKGVTDLTSKGFKDLDQSIGLALRSGAWSTVKEFFADFGTLGIVSTNMDEAKEFFKETDAGLANLVSSGHAAEAQKLFDQVATAAQKQGYSIGQVNDLLPAYSGALVTAKASAAGAIAPTEQLGGSINGVQVSAEDTTDAIDKLVQSLADAGLVQLSARDASRQFQQALADAAAEAKKGKKTLSEHSEEGRKNAASLDAVASAAIRQAQSIYDSTKATKGTGPAEEAFRQSLVKSRDSLVATARKFGMSRDEAEKYADKVLNIPAVKSTKVTLSGAEAAITEATRIARAIAKIPGRKTIDVVTRKIGAQGGNMMASGGYVVGPGTSTSDSVPAQLSAGEYVVKAAAVQKYGVAAFDRLNAMRFAAGGFVPASGVASSVSVSAPAVSMPSQLVVVDAGGQLMGTLMVAADQRIAAYDREQSRSLRSGAGRR
jgi:TP901 family phage tail tape measure protein